MNSTHILTECPRCLSKNIQWSEKDLWWECKACGCVFPAERNKRNVLWSSPK